MKVALTLRVFDRWRVTGFMRYDNLSGTAFEDSPVAAHVLMVEFALSYVFTKSKRMVEVKKPVWSGKL